MEIFSADFETNNHIEACRVWSAGCYNIYTKLYKDFNNIESFMNYIFNLKESVKIFFHNLKFDGNFIVHYLYKNNFTYVEDEKSLKDKTFTTIISDKGQWYFIGVKLKKKIFRFYDSYKILPFKLSKLAEAFNLEIKKGSIDYNKYRPENYIATKEEKEYQKNDCLILGQSIFILMEELKLNKMTIGSNALSDYKRTVNFKYLFPKIKNYNEMVKAYKGGFTYVNPKYKNKKLGKILVLDVNSLYPFVMSTKLMPFGNPIYFEGEYKKDFDYPLYIQYVLVDFELKPEHIPTLQLKYDLRYCPTEYITKSNGETLLCLTSVDLDLFKKHYNFDEKQIRYLYGWKFRGSTKLFREYISKWNTIKEQADKDGNKPLRTIAKLMNNNLGGKFGTNINRRQLKPIIKEGVLRYEHSFDKIIDGVYLPVAAFMTAYAREYTITAAQKNYWRYVYSDTDSLHLLGHELPDLPIDATKLGFWKIENKFDNGKFLRAKCYLESKKARLKRNKQNIIFEEYYATVAGLPEEVQKTINYDNFYVGKIFNGKKTMKNVKNGLVLIESEFTIKK